MCSLYPTTTIYTNTLKKPIDEDQTLSARVLCLHNPGEDLALFRRTIDVLTGHGYEVMFYETPQHLKFSSGNLSHELDYAITLCLEDMRLQNIEKLSLHLMGHFICGANALLYGIQGQHRHRLSTIVGINPLVQPNDDFIKQGSSIKFKWKAKMNPDTLVDLQTDMSLFTKDPAWLAYLREMDYSFTQFTNSQLKAIQDTSQILTTKKTSSKFDVENVLVIQSIEDPLSSIQGTKQFINNTGAKSAFLLEYTKGMNNLFLEREKLFQRLITDLIAWLKEN